jgi:hypothetical protein
MFGIARRRQQHPAGGANNTYKAYDTLGRQLFLALTAKC